MIRPKVVPLISGQEWRTPQDIFGIKLPVTYDHVPSEYLQIETDFLNVIMGLLSEFFIGKCEYRYLYLQDILKSRTKKMDSFLLDATGMSLDESKNLVLTNSISHSNIVKYFQWSLRDLAGVCLQNTETNSVLSDIDDGLCIYCCVPNEICGKVEYLSGGRLFAFESNDIFQ